jgi:general secretion pathway protein H
LSAELTALRDRAVRRRIVTALTIAEDNSGYVAGADGARHNLPAGLTLSYQSTRPPLVGDAPEQIVFYPDGSASGGAILVRRGDYAITIHVGWLDGRVWLDG